MWIQKKIAAKHMETTGKSDEAVVRREYNVRSAVDCILAFILGKEIVQQGQKHNHNFHRECSRHTLARPEGHFPY